VELPQTGIASVIYVLLPGFLAAWLFYGLAGKRARTPFEYIVHALVFTAIVQALVLTVRGSFLWIGRLASIGAWTNEVAFVWSTMTAVLVGLASAVLANKEWILLKRSKCLGLLADEGEPTSLPPDSPPASNQDQRYVVLHLSGGRRLCGSPFEWPHSSDSGHFVVIQPEWLLEQNKHVPLQGVERMSVAAQDVERIEFGKSVAEFALAIGTSESAEEKSAETQQEEPEEPSNAPSSKRTIKRKVHNPFRGRWHIVSMDKWDEDHICADGQGYLEFHIGGRGSLHFGYVHSQTDYRLTERNGQPAVEFTFEGNNDMAPTMGRGWGALDSGVLKGVVFFHQGEESAFAAHRVRRKRLRKAG
jgi:hypothetical protein